MSGMQWARSVLLGSLCGGNANPAMSSHTALYAIMLCAHEMNLLHVSLVRSKPKTVSMKAWTSAARPYLLTEVGCYMLM